MAHKVAWAVAAGGIAFLGIALVASQTSAGSPAPSPLPPDGLPPGPTPTPTPGCVPLTLAGSGPGMVSGCGGQARNSSTSLCPSPGEQCVFTAWPDPGAQFLHWAGPGVTAPDNPITLPIYSPGFVNGFFGQGSAGPGSPPPPTPPPSPPGLPACPRSPGYMVSNGQSGSKVYVIDQDGLKDWIPNGWVQAACLFGPGQVTTCDVDAVPSGPDVGWPGCAGI